jgi:hypothetical protein
MRSPLWFQAVAAVCPRLWTLRGVGEGRNARSVACHTLEASPAPTSSESEKILRSSPWVTASVMRRVRTTGSGLNG